MANSTANINSQVSGTEADVTASGAARSATLSANSIASYDPSDAILLRQEEATLTHGTNAGIAFDSGTTPLGNSAAVGHVLFLKIENLASGGGAALTVQSSEPWLSGTGAAVVIPVGGFVEFGLGTAGVAVTGGTTGLTLSNADAALSLTYRVSVVGK